MRRILFLVCVISLLLISGCGSKPVSAPTVAYALQGPELFIVGEYQGKPVRGYMDRRVMVGIGKIHVEANGAQPTQSELICESVLDTPPSEKGRIRGVLDCSQRMFFVFTLRSLGPDQGVGIGRIPGSGDLLVFFFHSSLEEAQRRFPLVKADIDEARKRSQ